MRHSTRARARARAAVLGLVLTTGLTATVGSAAGIGLPVSYTRSDETGDVTITEKRGLAERQRRSIDLSAVQVREDADSRRVEVLVQLRSLTGSRRFDQVVRLEFRRPGEGLLGDVRFTPSPGDRRDGSAALYDENGSKACFDLRTRTSGEEGLATVRVPYRCIPAAPAEVVTRTSTSQLYGSRSELRAWSRDDAASDGLVQLRTPDPATG